MLAPKGDEMAVIWNTVLKLDSLVLEISPNYQMHKILLAWIFLNIAMWDFDYFGSNNYLDYILSIK